MKKYLDADGNAFPLPFFRWIEAVQDEVGGIVGRGFVILVRRGVFRHFQGPLHHGNPPSGPLK